MDDQNSRSRLTIGTGIKLGIGMTVGVSIVLLIVIAALSLLGYLVFRRPSTSPEPVPAQGASSIRHDANYVAELAALSDQRKLQKRMGGIQGINESLSTGAAAPFHAFATLTGPDQSVITITAVLDDLPDRVAGEFAEGFFREFLPDVQTTNEMAALGITKIVMTDRKRSWGRTITRDGN